MALIKCPECGKEISEHAQFCPHCGCPEGLISKAVSKQKEMERHRNAEQEAKRQVANEETQRRAIEQRRIQEQTAAKRSALENARKNGRIALSAPVHTGQRFPMGEWGRDYIEWRVLDVSGKDILVITDKVIDLKTYNDDGFKTCWKKCALREWLNEAFLQKAFTNSERRFIKQTHLDNPGNALFETPGSDATTDLVFCLSIQEAEKYFARKEDREASPTSFVVSQMPIADNVCSWWLRSPGESRKHAALVLFGGYISERGASIRASEGVRPAMWISLE